MKSTFAPTSNIFVTNPGQVFIPIYYYVIPFFNSIVYRLRVNQNCLWCRPNFFHRLLLFTMFLVPLFHWWLLYFTIVRLCRLSLIQSLTITSEGVLWKQTESSISSTSAIIPLWNSQTICHTLFVHTDVMTIHKPCLEELPDSCNWSYLSLQVSIPSTWTVSNNI